MERIDLEQGLVRVPDAASFLAVSRSELYKLMDLGEIKYCKIGKCRRIPKQALVEFARERLVSSRKG